MPTLTELRKKISDNNNVPKFARLDAALNCIPLIETKLVPTAATDGLVILVNPDFLAQQTMSQAIGLLQHEFMHIRFEHHEISSLGMHNPQALNMAMDDEINSLLIEAGFSLPNDGCHPRQIGEPGCYNWGRYYPKRLAEVEQQQDDQPGEGQPQDGQAGEPQNADSGSATDGADSDENGSPADAGDSKGDSNEQSDSQSADQQDAAQDGSGCGAGSDQPADQEVADGVHSTGELAKQFAPELLDDIEQAKQDAIEAATNAASSSIRSQLDQQLQRLERDQRVKQAKQEVAQPYEIEADADRWQDIVVDTFRKGETSSVDWGRRGRRSNRNTYFPGKRQVNGLNLVLVLDVSGSCRKFFNAWQSLVDQLIEEVPELQKLHIVYHDDRIVKTDEWEACEGDYTVQVPRSWGGTNHATSMLYIAEELDDIDGVLVFSDCDTCDWGEDHQYPQVAVIPQCEKRDAVSCPWGVNVYADITPCYR